jgi:glycosyltransferase involved in cell wall biosynthesis
MAVFVSIICPTYNEEKYIAKCIDSIIRQDYPVENMELLFVDGRSTDKTRKIITEYQEKYRFIKLLDNPHKVVPYAMNIGIKNSTGNIIIRIDAHTFYPSDYVRILSGQLIKLNVENVGVCCITDVLNKTPKTLAIKEVLSHPLGVGNSMFRLGTDKIIEVDTVPFGCFRKEIFEKYGLYNEKLVRNQDIELHKRIKRGDGKIVLIPIPVVFIMHGKHLALL